MPSNRLSESVQLSYPFCRRVSRSCQSVPSKNSVRHDPQKYDFVIPQTGEWLKMSRKWYDISPNKINLRTDRPEKLQGNRPRRFSVAPMMEWTDRHCRFFHRLLTRRAL